MQRTHVARAERANAKGDGSRALELLRLAEPAASVELRVRAAVVKCTALAAQGMAEDAVIAAQDMLATNPPTGLQLRLLTAVVPAIPVNTCGRPVLVECMQANLDSAVASAGVDSVLVLRAIEVFREADSSRAAQWIQCNSAVAAVFRPSQERTMAETAAPSAQSSSEASREEGALARTGPPASGWFATLWEALATKQLQRAGAAVVLVATMAILMRVIVSRMSGGRMQQGRTLAL